MLARVEDTGRVANDCARKLSARMKGRQTAIRARHTG